MSGHVQREVGSPIAVLITLVAVAASVFLALTAEDAFGAISGHGAEALAYLALILVLQAFSVPVYGSGSISVSSIATLGAGFALGPGVAMAFAVIAAIVQWGRARGLLHRAIFDAANFSLAAGAGVAAYELVGLVSTSVGGRLVAAVVAGLAYTAVNISLLTLAMSVSEGLSALAVWRERFRWLTLHYVAFGPLALASTIAYERVGVVGFLAFALPPALMIFSVRQYLERTRESVEAVRLANAELRRANVELADRNEDLHELFQLAGGLAAHGADRDDLVAYTERALSGLTGVPVSVRTGPVGSGIALVTAGKRVGSLELEHDPVDRERWERLRDAVVPHLATAIANADLVEQIKRTHVATIAALSRAIEAKDCYTGGHTERVSALSVALAKRLGFAEADVQTIEVGALLHDIGKIGTPERLLNKPGPLDDDEWEVMKKHPIVSDYILSEANLPPLVRQIARWSHERVDGKGYPDGLAGDEIPLAARIVFVADAFDALTSDRPYRPARHARAALEELRANSGSQFCPLVVQAFERVFEDRPELLGAPALRAVEVA